MTQRPGKLRVYRFLGALTKDNRDFVAHVTNTDVIQRFQ